MRILFVCVLLAVCTVTFAEADEREDALELFTAYQQGYLDVVAVSCFQLYSSSGVVTTDYLNDYIDADTALEALDHNRLLLSVCITTLERIRGKTPVDDIEAHREFNRLGTMLTALRSYLDASSRFMLEPTQDAADAADVAQFALDQAMEEFAGPPLTGD